MIVKYYIILTGCGKLYVADGNWKLRYAHCMWKVHAEVPGFGKANYPAICPLSPKRGHAFCQAHCEQAQELGYPTLLREFLKKCGISEKNVDEGSDVFRDFNPYYNYRTVCANTIYIYIYIIIVLI